MQRFIMRSLFAIIALLVAPVVVVLAQACPQLVETAISEIAVNCANAEDGSTCYGFPNVQTVFMGDVGLNIAQPGDRADNLMLQSLKGSAFNADTHQWGISINTVEANLPLALPGPGGVFITLGDVRVENGVLPSDAVVLPETSFEFTIGDEGAALFSAPPGYPLKSEVVGSVRAGTVLEGDAVSEDGAWMRVYYVYERTYGSRADAWVQIAKLDGAVDVDELGVIGVHAFTPMQKFYLTNAFDEQPCDEAAPSMLYVQGPDEIEMDFVVNAAAVRLSSTAMIRVLPDNTMLVLALSGVVQLDPLADEPVVLVPGFFSTICLLPQMQSLGIDGEANDRQIDPACDWAAPEPYPADALNRLYTALNERIPQSLQYYLLDAPRASCPSGIGGAQCRIIIGRAYRQIERLCRQSVLEPAQCEILLP